MAYKERSDILGKIESRWALWVAVGGTSLVSGASAYITEWLKEWGPIAWVFSALFGGLLAATIYGIVSTFYSKWVLAREAVRASENTGTNPLDHDFKRTVIRVSEFFNRDYRSHKAKTFRDCGIEGPGNLFITGGTINGADFRHCQIVIINEEILQKGIGLYNVTRFEDCQIIGGYISTVTLFVTQKMYDNFPEDMRKYIPKASA